jgi:hypothetical protein
MAFTSALDNTYATDAQLYQLYHATASLNTQTGSQDLVNLGISSVTGSLIGITNGLMAFTAALDSTYATDAQLYQLYAETASIKAEIGGIEAYTASLKGAEIVSSSQQITNYYKFAETASANTFYGDQTITGSLAIKDSETNFLIEGNGFSQTYLTSNGGIVLNPGYGGIEMVGSYRTFKATDITADGFVSGEIRATNNVVSSSVQITELAPLMAYTSSLKNAFTIDGNNDVYFSGKITTQEVHTTYTTSSVLFQSGSTKFGNSSDDIHEFTGSKFEVFNSDTSGTMYAVVKNNRARNAAVKTTTTNGSFIAGTSIGTDTFQYQIYDEVEGVNRVTINSQGGTTIQGAVSASQTLRVTGKTQIGTSTVDTSLGSNTKLSVVGDGSVNAGASQGSMFVGAGVTGGDTGLPLNMGTAGATMMLLASINTSTGTSTNSATYVLQFYFDGNNVPNAMFLTGSSNFVTFAATPSNTLAISGSSSGNKSYAWFINKFGA